MVGVGKASARRPGLPLLAVVLALAAVLSGCGGKPAAAPKGSPSTDSAGTAVAAAPDSTPAAVSASASTRGSARDTNRSGGRPDHVVVAIFENKDYAQIAGNPSAPYLNTVLDRSAVLINAHGVAHPSQPNYLALFSGSNQQIPDDRCFTPLSNRPNLGRQLLDTGHTFVGYSEDLPQVGYTGCTAGRYAAKHNPWVHFADLPAGLNQPLTAFPTDFATLPTVAFVVPNLCNDMHDCPVAVGDGWARQHLDAYLTWAHSHNSLLIVTFDENDGRPDNRILTVFAGAGVKAGRYDEPVDHYRVLRTIESFYQLPPLGQPAAGPATGAPAGPAPITNIWS
jgi:hypothetical protein